MRHTDCGEELATNAIRHSASNEHFFQVRCEVFPDYVWVEVQDLGGVWHCRQRDGRPHGLDIVAVLVGDNWGVETTSDGDRIVWARVEFGGDDERVPDFRRGIIAWARTGPGKGR